MKIVSNDFYWRDKNMINLNVQVEGEVMAGKAWLALAWIEYSSVKTNRMKDKDVF
jgi:hypothetical protein